VNFFRTSPAHKHPNQQLKASVESTASQPLKDLTMSYTPELLDELNILIRFDLVTNQQGLKVHTNTADAKVVSAMRRLHDKGLVTLPDGGYLTSLGRNATVHAHAALTLLTEGSAQLATKAKEEVILSA
jgi:uncharacterized protein (TIGR02647 family)